MRISHWCLNISFSISILLYHIIPSKNIDYAVLSWYWKIWQYLPDSSLHCMTGKKDYKCNDLNRCRNLITVVLNNFISLPRNTFVLSKWSILPCSMFTSNSGACTRFTYLISLKYRYRYCSILQKNIVSISYRNENPNVESALVCMKFRTWQSENCVRLRACLLTFAYNWRRKRTPSAVFN